MKSKKILFVEDNIIAAEAIKGFLANRWENLDVVGSAEEALDIFLEKRHNILITDIALPYMNGFELIRKIKDIDSDVEIFVVSATDNQENLKNAKELGVSKFFPKPIDLDLLESAVRGACN